MGKLIDLTGQRFGRLTVIKRVGIYRPASNPNHSHPCWLCRCDCGEEIITIGQNLRQGKTMSCGCLRREKCKKNLEDWRKRNEDSVG